MPLIMMVTGATQTLTEQYHRLKNLPAMHVLHSITRQNRSRFKMWAGYHLIMRPWQPSFHPGYTASLSMAGVSSSVIGRMCIFCSIERLLVAATDCAEA